MSKFKQKEPSNLEKENKDLTIVLANVLEWAKIHRGRIDIDCYAVPEVREALKILAKLHGYQSYLDVDTDKLSKGNF